MSDNEVVAESVPPYGRVVGRVIRSHRVAKGWSRTELREAVAALLPDADELRVQTLGAYELGTRRISVDRLDVIARALGTCAHALLADADLRAHGLLINLRALARAEGVYIAPAAKWAALTARALIHGGAEPVIELTPAALGKLAELCNLDPDGMRALVLDYQVHPGKATAPVGN